MTMRPDPQQQGAIAPKPYLGYFHVRKEDVRAGSACEVDPPFASLDLVLRRDFEDEATRAGLLESAVRHVLRYGHVGKQSEVRLRSALRAVEVSRDRPPSGATR